MFAFDSHRDHLQLDANQDSIVMNITLTIRNTKSALRFIGFLFVSFPSLLPHPQTSACTFLLGFSFTWNLLLMPDPHYTTTTGPENKYLSKTLDLKDLNSH